jgi:hypothetical protein
MATGFPHECIESWMVAAHDASESQRQEERSRLPFDPFSEPHHLSHKENVPRSAKDLCKRLQLDEESTMRRLLAKHQSADAGLRGPLDHNGASAFLVQLDRLLSSLAGASGASLGP